jgi:hypothetical protein
MIGKEQEIDFLLALKRNLWSEGKFLVAGRETADLVILVRYVSPRYCSSCPVDLNDRLFGCGNDPGQVFNQRTGWIQSLSPIFSNTFHSLSVCVGLR